MNNRQRENAKIVMFAMVYLPLKILSILYHTGKKLLLPDITGRWKK